MELNTMSEPVEQPLVTLDAEDTEALMIECHEFVSSVIGRSGNPKWLEKSGHDLLKRLTEVLAWHKLQ